MPQALEGLHEIDDELHAEAVACTARNMGQEWVLEEYDTATGQAQALWEAMADGCTGSDGMSPEGEKTAEQQGHDYVLAELNMWIQNVGD